MPLLLDFDGPVCSIFAGLPAPTIAAELCKLLAAQGHPMPVDQTTDNPHEVLLYAATISRNLAHQVEERLATREIEAAATARPTPGGHELIRAWHTTGRPLAIVSNNTTPAVRTYLDRHNLTPHVDEVEGRDPHDPKLMKPDPHVIHSVCLRLGCDPTQCVLVGDSITDVQAGQAAGTPVTGYANKPSKHLRLMAHGLAAIISRMPQLAAALTC